jgi:hypothetical protein
MNTILSLTLKSISLTPKSKTPINLNTLKKSKIPNTIFFQSMIISHLWKIERKKKISKSKKVYFLN